VRLVHPDKRTPRPAGAEVEEISEEVFDDFLSGLFHRPSFLAGTADPLGCDIHIVERKILEIERALS
jgi:hypothetical protein